LPALLLVLKVDLLSRLNMELVIKGEVYYLFTKFLFSTMGDCLFEFYLLWGTLFIKDKGDLLGFFWYWLDKIEP
jgi:hypothetical protein